MKQCQICGLAMVNRKWKVDFIVAKQKFITVVNYPLYVCPYCGSQVPKEKANELILTKLSEQECCIVKPSAINFEESF